MGPSRFPSLAQPAALPRDPAFEIAPLYFVAAQAFSVTIQNNILAKQVSRRVVRRDGAENRPSTPGGPICTGA